MNKSLMYLIIGVTTTIGGYIPSLLGASDFSSWSILGVLLGGVAGIWIIWKMKNSGY